MHGRRNTKRTENAMSHPTKSRLGSADLFYLRLASIMDWRSRANCHGPLRQLEMLACYVCGKFAGFDLWAFAPVSVRRKYMNA